MFYLNYVGCKVKRFVIYIFGILRFTLTMWDVKFLLKSCIILLLLRFTLTMWDVKYWDTYTFTFLPAFYLNYVGCKDFIVNEITIKLICFTLTMWDVKSLFFTPPRQDDFRFTLTMWDVKKKGKRQKILSLVGFTLTMWDVKSF